MAITKNASQTKRTVQGILNKSYDEDFDILAMELVGYDSDAGVLRRVKTNADGEIQLDTTALDARYVNVTGDTIQPTSNSTTTFQVNQADTTNVLTVDTTNGRVGIGTTGPGALLDVAGAGHFAYFGNSNNRLLMVNLLKG